MSYLAAAYGIVAVTLVAYALYLTGERRQLRRSLGERADRSAANPPERARAS